MAEKIYPGDLKPISDSPEAEQLQKQRYQDLCEYYGVPVPSSRNELEALLSCLLARHLRHWAQPWLPLISNMTARELAAVLNQLFLDFLPGLCVEDASVKKRRRTTKNAPVRDIMFHSLFVKGNVAGKYHFGAEQKTKQILRENPYLEYKSRKSKPWKTAHSNERRLIAEAKKKDAPLSERIKAFESTCTPEELSDLNLKLKHWSESKRKLGSAKAEDNTAAVASLEAETEDRWMEIIRSPLGDHFRGAASDTEAFLTQLGDSMRRERTNKPSSQ